MKGFKVTIRNLFLNRVSCWVDEKREYYIDKWTKPQKGFGPLCVFKTLENAINFANGFHILFMEVYKCKYKKSIKRNAWLFNKYGILIKATILPKGTKLARKVKLVEKVYENFREE